MYVWTMAPAEPEADAPLCIDEWFGVRAADLQVPVGASRCCPVHPRRSFDTWMCRADHQKTSSDLSMFLSVFGCPGICVIV